MNGALGISMAIAMFWSGYLLGDLGTEIQTYKRIVKGCEQRQSFTFKSVTYTCRKVEK
jgi:hypothetical protein